MVFSNYVDKGVREEIGLLWGNGETLHYEKYLGLPPLVGRLRIELSNLLKRGFSRSFKLQIEITFSRG